ncbi:hypothetical protein [Companilactobacillus mishanensis]|uniref:ABC transporter permease n=1 Tax=Companilactobacillus mishanensis TaxID=2486008 RepID=A0ABW9P8R9_9LACO|nr:hypothetical protein [Companilactobacillus mishanensis]MQS45610.1 hypothetical protein [Companilactobacillus mishanensis]
MLRLLMNQWLFFFQIIKKRLFVFISIVCIAEILIGMQTFQNPNLSVISQFFDGVSIMEIKSQQVHLPVLWFCYLLIPGLILMNSIDQVTKSNSIKLRGLKFSTLELGAVNLVLISLISLLYTCSTFLVFLLLFKIDPDIILNPNSIINNQLIIYLASILFLVIFVLLTVQCLIAVFEPRISIVGPIIILIYTIFNPNKWNILNNTMLSRFNSQLNIQLLLITMIVIFTISALYLYLIRSSDLT